jgi:hypothetical protein
MDKPKFNFGDYVFHAAVEGATEWIPCPDCNGDGYVTIVYQGETYTMDCEGCKRGYEGSSGRRERYTYEPIVREGTVEGVERYSSEPYEFEYRLRAGSCSFWVLKEQDTFATREEAEARAVVLKKEFDNREASRVIQKLKPDKSWAWHVHYYKSQIAEAQKSIDYATLQLNAAKKHVKEDHA